MTFTAGAKRTKAREGVFISYARSDGEDFAARLRARLEGAGPPLWQDRVGMEGGRDWWLQITEALDRVEFMVLVLTPNALRSDTVRKEWRYARQQGVCVYPVKGTPELDYESLPRWMRESHFYDLGTLEGEGAGPEWAKFLNDLRTRCQTRRVPFMVEDLPDDFVERPGEFDQLIRLLLDGERGEPVAITAALRGAGGYGKTTLARALCHDERVQGAFDDGVLWVTLGETPGDLTGRVEDLIYTLSDERPGFTGLDAATAHLVELLADRDILVVIDDVWNGAHLRPFLQGGPRCARLVTTRNFDTLPPDARKVDVDAMRRAEALALLGASLPDGGEQTLAALAARLGEWPLLLKLVNGALRDRVLGAGQPLPNALAYVNKGLDRRGLTFFDARDAASREQAVAQTLGISFERLSAADRARYGELAVFPEDVDIPLAALEKLWRLTGGLDDLDTEELCDRLHRLSLLLRFDPTTRTVRLHDVIRAYLIQQQGQGLAPLHGRLLDAHRPAGNGEDAPTVWADMPADEPYLWDHLAYHLTGAGLGDELVATVKDLRYLAAKTFQLKSLPAENDLLVAEAHAPDDKQLQLLRRTFVQSGHILNRCDTRHDAEATLLCRLQHLPELSDLTDALSRTLTPPYIVPQHPLPDLPHPALLRTINAHDTRVSACAFSPDGSFIVSASDDTTLKVWDTKTGSERLMLVGHTSAVLGCAISPDGSFIVSASDDKTLKVWDADGGAEVMTLAGHEGGVNDCAISPDGSFIVSASDDRTLKVWDARSGAERFTLVGSEHPVSGCAVGPDGSYILSASDDGLRVWDAETGRERRNIQEPGNILDCVVSPDGTFFAAGSRMPTLVIWDAETGAKRHTLHGHSYEINGLAVTPDSGVVISCSLDGTVRAWDADAGTELFRLIGHSNSVEDCAVSPDGSLLVTASRDQTLKLWDVASGGAPCAASAHADWVVACDISHDASLAVTTSWDKTTKVWNAARMTERLTLIREWGLINDCAISPDGSLVVAVTTTLEVSEVGTGALLPVNFRADGCIFSPDGSFLLSWEIGGGFRSYSTASWEEQIFIKIEGIQCCAISPDNSLLATAHHDGTLKLWSVDGAGVLQVLSSHNGTVHNCVFSPGASFLVSASEDATLKVWDTSGGGERLTLAGHRSAVSACAVSPDESLVASTSDDWSVKVWDVGSGKCLATFHAEGQMNDCRWLGDGRRLLAVGNNGVYFLRLVM
ncbi:MAG: TIR domain-containing protein [Pyrinomonadaceae bacterium]